MVSGVLRANRLEIRRRLVLGELRSTMDNLQIVLLNSKKQKVLVSHTFPDSLFS